MTDDATQPTAAGDEPGNEPLADIVVRAARASGVELPEDHTHVPRCEGGCGAAVCKRRTWCAACAEESRAQVRKLALATAYESVSLGGALGWCRAGTPEYEARTARALEIAKRRDPRAAELLRTAVWKRAWGSLLVIGPTSIGKSTLLVAIGHRILDAALSGQTDLGQFYAAMRLRAVSGKDLAKAEKRHPLGVRAEPPEISGAKKASILLLDEIGFEDQSFDPHAVRDVIRDRATRGLPTLATSGRTRGELDERYGAATLAHLVDQGRGHTIDLHDQPSRIGP